jgi:peptidase E
MGGGGFSMEPDNLRLDRFVLEKARKPNPVVCFVPTASGDAQDYIGRFYDAFRKLPCQPRHLSMVKPPWDLPTYIAECDVIYVGGGNTRNLLAIWREWQLDAMMRHAWENGTVLAGLSAGAICWFEHGLTDSAGPLRPIRCLGFLGGSCAPHFDGEAGRRPAFHACIREGTLPSGYGLDDGAALYYVGTEVADVVSSRPHARAFRVRPNHGDTVEEPIQPRLLPA